MANRIIDATLRFRDQFSGKLGEAAGKIEAQQKHLNAVSGKITKVGKSMTKAGKTLTVGVTAPIAAFAAKSVQTAADFESAMSKVQSISGATGADMDLLSKKAQEMGGKTKFSASESADAFSYMAMAGWKTADMLDGIEGIMYLAGATGEDLASTSDIVTDALTAFGLSAKDTQHFVDVLAATSNNANTNVSMLGESFKYVAPAAGALGYSVDDVSTALGIMANSGIKAGQAGTALRSLLTNLAKPSKQVKDAMETLGVSLTDANGQMKPMSALMSELRGKFATLTEAQKAQYAAALAGKTGMSGLLAIVNASDEDFRNLSDSISDCTGASKEMYDVANNNLNGQLTVLKSTLESIMITVGNKLTPVVKKVVDKLQEWGDKLKGLDDSQVETIVKIAGVVAAVGPLLLGLGKTITVVGKVVKTVRTVRTAISTFSTVLSAANPTVLIVVAAVAALAAVAIVVYKNWDKIKPLFEKCGAAIKKFGDWCKNTMGKIRDWFSQTWSKIKNGINEAHRKLRESTGVIGAVYTNIHNKISAIKQTFQGVIQFIKGVFTGNWKAAWQGVVNIFSGIWNNLKSVVKAPLNGVIGVVNSAIRAINKISVTIPDWVPGVGGKHIGFNINTIPFLAQGSAAFAGGPAVINERGGELVRLPHGTSVLPHDKTVAQMYKTGAQDAAAGIRGQIVQLAAARAARDNSRTVEVRTDRQTPAQQPRTININLAKIADEITVRDEKDIRKLADEVAEEIAMRLEETEDNIA